MHAAGSRAGGVAAAAHVWELLEVVLEVLRVPRRDERRPLLVLHREAQRDAEDHERRERADRAGARERLGVGGRAEAALLQLGVEGVVVEAERAVRPRVAVLYKRGNGQV